jgi:acyl-CoA dehydrogenase
VFDRPIGQNQGVQFPIAEAYIETEAASLMRFKRLRAVRRAEALRRRGQHGQAARGQGLVGSRECLPADPRRLRLRGEYDVERKFRETRLYQVAPISTNLILSYIAEHQLGLPRSF